MADLSGRLPFDIAEPRLNYPILRWLILLHAATQQGVPNEGYGARGRRTRGKGRGCAPAQGTGLTIDETVCIVLEQAAAGCGPDFGALIPNATTVEAIEAARRGDVVELGTPAEALAELNRDD